MGFYRGAMRAMAALRRIAPSANTCEPYEDEDASALRSPAGICPLPKVDAPADTSPVANDAVYSRSQVCAVEACGDVPQESVVATPLSDSPFVQTVRQPGSRYWKPVVSHQVAHWMGQRKPLHALLAAGRPPGLARIFWRTSPRFFSRCQRSSTCCACGAPLVAPLR
jgi:hypothetical protein